MGAAGSFLLLLPPAADQFSKRVLSGRHAAADKAPAALKETSDTAVQVSERHFSRWKSWESLSMAAGGALLMLSFWF